MTRVQAQPTLESIVDDSMGALARSDGYSIRYIVQRLFANAIAGSNSEFTQAFISGNSVGGSTVLGMRSKAGSPAQAAGANAAAIVVSQCDEGLREARGHPGLHAFSAALAVVESMDGTVNDLFEATAVGWEIGARIGLHLGPTVSGVHPHGGWGVAAAAAAAAAAMGAEESIITRAVANALTLGLVGPDGSTFAGQSSHYLLPAIGTSNGVIAAELTLAGVQPPNDSLAHFAAVAHSHPSGDSPLSNEAGSLMDFAYFKPVGLCAHALTSWEAALNLAPLVKLDDVSTVTVRTYFAASRLLNQVPTNLLARQFSIPWAVASGLATEHPLNAGNEYVARLAKVVRVDHDPALDALYPASRPAFVSVNLKNGKSIDGFAEFHRGDRERPLDEESHGNVNMQLLGLAVDQTNARKAYAVLADRSFKLRKLLDCSKPRTQPTFEGVSL